MIKLNNIFNKIKKSISPNKKEFLDIDEIEMYNLSIIPELKYIFEETLFHRFNIDIDNKYEFFYTEVFQHLVNNSFDKNPILSKNPDIFNTDYLFYKQRQIYNFKKQLLNHVLVEKEFDKLKNPQKHPEIIQQLRKQKLLKLNERQIR